MNADSKFFKAFDRINTVLLKVETVLLVISIVALVASIFIEVICRYVLFISTAWSEELARYLFVWLTYIGSAYALNEGQHVEIDIAPQVVGKLTFFRNKKEVNRFFEYTSAIGSVLFLIVFCVIFNSFILFVMKGTMTSPTMHIPMAYVYMPVLAGSMLAIYHGVYLIICNLFHVPLPKDRK